MNPLSIIKYQLYLLQIENYEIFRYWSLLFRKGYYSAKEPLRKKLEITPKILTIILISLILFILVQYFTFSASTVIGFCLLILSLLVLPLYFSISLTLLLPIDFLSKAIIMSKAKKLVANYSDLRIIGIAGSYGKTTMKNVLSIILQEKYKIISTPGNVNTPVGISKWLLTNSLNDVQILIIEFGEEYAGDNRKIAKLFPQDFVIISGINEAHFERMGSIEKISATIFEAVEGAKTNAFVYLNADDKNVLDNYKNYIGNKKYKFISQNNNRSELEIKNKKFDDDRLVWQAEISGLGKIEVPLLAEYIFVYISAAILIAHSLDMNYSVIKKGLLKIRPIEHRLQPVRSTSGILVIDDSYNGNPAGVNEAINTLNRFKHRRRIYLTPGLVETGTQNKKIHLEIGKKLAKAADKVILIKNSATPFIEEGLKSEGFSNNNIIWFDHAEKAHKSLGSILEPKDVILFQNDWGDQYL